MKMKKLVANIRIPSRLLGLLIILPFTGVSIGVHAVANPCLSRSLVPPPGCEPPPPAPPPPEIEGSEVPVKLVPIALDDLTIIIPIESEYLPPDPGEEGKAGVEGVDSDGDNVRDDVERHIAYKYPNEPQTRAILYEYAKETQNLLNDAQNAEATKANSEQMRKTRRCIQIIRRMEGDAEYVAMDVRAVTVNTLERFRRQQEIDKKLSGVYELIPSSSTDCD